MLEIPNKIRTSGISISLLLILSIVLVPNIVPNTSAQEIQSSVTIIGACGATPEPNSLSYGSLPPGATSTEQTIILKNTLGNVPADVQVKGTNWKAGNVDKMSVDTTAYSTATSSYETKTKLTTTDAVLGTVPALGQLNTFWQLKIVLSDPAFTGNLKQVVTLTVTC